MKTSTKIILIGIIVFAFVYWLFKTKKLTIEKKKPCLCNHSSTSKEDLINSIIDKNEAFLLDLAAQFNVEPENFDLTWLNSKSVEDLTDLLKMNALEFKNALIAASNEN